jgi:hypothetical protein
MPPQELAMLGKLLGVAFVLLLLMLVGLTLVLFLGIGAYLWDEHRLLVISIGCCGAAVGAIMLRRRSPPQAAEGDRQQPNVHPGITMHAIPIGGGIGLVFTIGYVVMFWFGAPPYRPIVLGAAALGGVVGALLIWFRRRPKPDRGDTSLLHLHDQTGIAPEQDEPQKGPDKHALNLASGAGPECPPLVG